MEGSTSSNGNTLMESQTSIQESSLSSELKHELDVKHDESVAFDSSPKEKSQRNVDDTEIKLEHNNISSCDSSKEIECNSGNSNQNASEKETEHSTLCDRPEVKMEKEEEMAASITNDDQEIDADLPPRSFQNSVIPHNEAVKPYKCTHCDKAFRFKSVRNNHMITHSEERPFKCNICTKGFKRKDDLAQHNRTHGKDNKESDSNTSGISEKDFISPDRIKEEFIESYHEENRNDPENKSNLTDKRYKCTSCGMTFSFHSLLRNHMVIHSEDRPFACSSCPKSFKRKYDLIKHKKTHPDLIESEVDEASELGTSKLGIDGDCSKDDEENMNNSDEISRLKEIAEETVPDYSLCEGKAGDRPYKCSLCDLTFRLKGTLISHIVTHSREKPYKCSICHKGFKRKDNLAQHKKIHDNTKEKKSNKVERRGRKKKSALGSSEAAKRTSSNVKSTKEKDRYYSSLSSDVEDRPYKCTFCAFAFRLKTHLIRHTLIHSGERPHKCSICKKGFKRKDDMMKHESSHTSAKRLKSRRPYKINHKQGKDKDTEYFDEHTSLLDQEDDVEGGLDMEFLHGKSGADMDTSVAVNTEKCDFNMTKKIDGKSDLTLEDTDENVLKQALDDYEKQSAWQSCHDSKKDNSETKVDQSHDKNIKKLESDDLLSEYSGCNVVFSQEINQSFNHQSDSQSKLYVCSVCKKSYIRESDLKMHHKKMHDSKSKRALDSQRNERPYKCSLCDMAFRIKGNLKIHMLKHSDDKPFGCNVCKKAFKRKYDLDKHKEIHSRTEKFICSMCGRVFKGRNWLEKHMKYHESENSLQCSVCKKICQNRGQFIAHVKGHKKTPSSVCPLCGKSFTGGTNLKQHLRRHKGEKPFKCNICPRSFVSKGEMMRHVNSHTREKSYMCDICGNEFTLLSSLRTHARIHTGVKPFKCTLCSKSFNQSHHLKTHLRSHLGDKPHKCPVCEKAFSDRRTLRNHMLRHPNYVMPEQFTKNVKREIAQQFQINSFHPIQVPEKLVSPNLEEDGLEDIDDLETVTGESAMVSLKGFSEISNSGNPYRISQALEKVSSGMIADDLEMDEIMRISEGWEMNKPQEVPKESDIGIAGKGSEVSETIQENPPNYSGHGDIFDQGSNQRHQQLSQPHSLETLKTNSVHENLSIHQLDLKVDNKGPLELEDKNVEVSRTNEKQYQHESCDMSFSESSDLEIHTSKHSSEKQFVCNVCKKSFEEKEDLERHKKIHSKNNEHNCSMCGKSFRGKNWLANHMKFHENGNSLQCAVCKKVCQSKGQFISHIKGHKKVGSNVCTVCSKSFTSGNNLKQHLRRHKGEKPFKCTICPRSFVSKGEMMRHVNSHTREKSYMCDICGNEFTLLSSLRTHARIHTGVKPFKCTLCPKTFVQSHHLKTHLRSHLGDKPYKCTVCDKAFSDRRTLRNHMLRHTGNNSTDILCNNPVLEETKILQTPHGELLNLNYNHGYCENY